MAIVLLVSCFAGCGGKSGGKFTDDESKEVTLRFVFDFSPQKDLSLVNDELNKLVAKKLPNTKLEIICDSLSDKWQLWMAGDTSFDIASFGLNLSLLEEITKNSFIELDELIDTYAPTVKEEREGIYADQYYTGEYNEKLYGIPNIQYHIKETTSLKISQAVFNYFDTSALVEATHANPHTDENFYTAVQPILTEAIKRIKDVTENVAVLKPYSYVLVGEDHETLADIYLVDDENIVISGELMEGLNEDLENFWEDLAKEDVL